MDTARLAAKAYDHQARLDALAAAGDIIAYKTAVTGRSSGTRTADPDLQVELEGGVWYEFRAFLFWSGNTTGTGFFMGFNPPGGGGSATGYWGGTWNRSGSGQGNWANAWTNTETMGNTGGVWHGVLLAGTIKPGSSGTFSLDWGTGNGVNTLNLNVSSYIAFRRLPA